MSKRELSVSFARSRKWLPKQQDHNTLKRPNVLWNDQVEHHSLSVLVVAKVFSFISLYNFNLYICLCRPYRKSSNKRRVQTQRSIASERVWMLHVLYIDKRRWTQMHANACRHRCTHADVDISWHRGHKLTQGANANARGRTHRHICKRTLLDKRRENSVQCVGRRNLKMCPDVGRLFKDFWDVLYICIYGTVLYDPYAHTHFIIHKNQINAQHIHVILDRQLLTLKTYLPSALRT